MKPFLKWAGGKSRLLDAILPRLGPGGSDTRFFEPFVGSGAVFLGSMGDDGPSSDRFGHYLVNDANRDLIGLYRLLAKDPDTLIAETRRLFVDANDTSEVFYALRAEFNALRQGVHGDVRNPLRRAALFVYLNRHCFNGLCRFSQKGTFNVPYAGIKGGKVPPMFPGKAMASFANACQSRNVVFRDEGFQIILEEILSGSHGDPENCVVYCDPPYMSQEEGQSVKNAPVFEAYDSGRFGIPQHRLLAQLCRDLADRGATVVVSNHDSEHVRNIYRTALFCEMTVKRFISGQPQYRKDAKEVLALFGPRAASLRRVA